MLSTDNTDMTLKITQACESGTKFAKLFYEKLDKHRHAVGQLFHESASLVWNGNQINSKNNIIEFYGKLPTVETNLESIDAQPTTFFNEQAKILVLCAGTMKIARRNFSFTETFILQAENNVWKIISDTYRHF